MVCVELSMLCGYLSMLCVDILMVFFNRTSVDMERQSFMVLSPCPRPLPHSILLLMEDIQYMDVR